MTSTSVVREGVDYYKLAQQHLKNGKEYARTYSTVWFGIGYEAWQLSQLVETESGPRELWSLIAPADVTMSYFLSDAWDIPYSSLMNAKATVEFYHVLLGWDLVEMEKIGRAKLAMAKSWLSQLLANDLMDKVLVEMLKDGTETKQIELYVKQAKEEYSDLIRAPLLPKLGNGGEDVLKIPEIIEGKSISNLSEDDEEGDEIDLGEPIYEEVQDEDETEKDSDEDDAELSVAEQMAQFNKQRGPLQVQMGRAGEPLYRYIMRILNNYSMDEEESFRVEADLRERLQGYQQYPLLVYRDGLPIPVGMLVVSGTLDEEIAERVMDGLQKQLGCKR